MDVPVARRIERPGWLNLRTVLGLLLFAVAFTGGRALMRSANTTTLYWAATTDLAQDSTITAEKVRSVAVRLPEDVAGQYAAAAEAIEGRVLTRAVRAGELIPAGWLADDAVSTAARSMTIPVSPEHALGGALRAGDRIDVFATFDAGDVRARTTAVARDVEIRDVVTAGGLVVGEESVVGITVAVTPEEAANLAFAIRTAEIDIARLEGEAGGARTSTVRAEHFP